MSPYTQEFREWYRANYDGQEPDPNDEDDLAMGTAFEAGVELGRSGE